MSYKSHKSDDHTGFIQAPRLAKLIRKREQRQTVKLFLKLSIVNINHLQTNSGITFDHHNWYRCAHIHISCEVRFFFLLLTFWFAISFISKIKVLHYLD